MKSVKIGRAANHVRSVAIAIILLGCLISSLATTASAQVKQIPGWAVGSLQGLPAIATTDGNGKWDGVVLPQATYPAVAISRWDQNLWIIVTPKTNDFNSLIYRSDNGGKDWKPAFKADDHLHAISFSSAKIGIAVGDDLILYTTTSGATWTKGTVKQGLGTLKFRSAFCLDNKLAWAVGDERTLLSTTDGGKTWDKAAGKAPPLKGNYSSVWIVDKNHWWIAGDQGIAWTPDGGKTWSTNTSAGGFEAIQAVENDTVWAVGTKVFKNPKKLPRAKIYYTPDGGKTWNQSTEGVTGPLHGLWFTDKKTGWVVGDKGVFGYSSEDDEWVPQYQKGLFRAIVMFGKKNRPVRLDPSTSPDTAGSGVSYVSVSASGFPEGNITAENVRVEISQGCHEAALASTSAVSVVSASSDSNLISFLLPSGLAPGQYFVSISDSEEGDANFESSNCSVVNIAQ
jgi:photosystem II stability/assembly factor-like uncharacterized protein